MRNTGGFLSQIKYSTIFGIQIVSGYAQVGSEIDGISYNLAEHRRQSQLPLPQSQRCEARTQQRLDQPERTVERQLAFPRPRNSFHFSLVNAGEFCFVSCPFQPPNILPISSIFSDNTIYFLSSIDLVSHKTIKSTFNVSVFLIASRTHGCFSSRDRNVAIEIASITSINKLSIFNPSE